MKYIISAAAALLVGWSVWYLMRSIRRQLRGDCCCGCEKDCGACPCSGRKRSGTK